MDRLRRRIEALEREAPTRDDRVILRSLVSGGHGKPLVTRLHSIRQPDGGRVMALPAETDDSLYRPRECAEVGL